jgi:hypothetical protein
VVEGVGDPVLAGGVHVVLAPGSAGEINWRVSANTVAKIMRAQQRRSAVIRGDP